MFKRILVVVVAIALLVPVGVAGLWIWNQATAPAEAQTPAPEAKPEFSPTQTITVVGQGSARVKPDIAQISVGVETTGETVGEAVQENQTKMEAILAALKEAGIAEKDIQTMNYSISSEQPPQPTLPEGGTGTGETKPRYRVSNMVNVTVRDLDKVGDVLDAVIEAGANSIWGVSFSVDDPKAAQAEARSKAVTDAQTRAQALSELSGVKLGPVMSMSEVVSGGAVPMYAMADRAAGGGGSISPGEVEVSYQVQVSYFIER
jgi:uncharacterized protein